MKTLHARALKRFGVVVAALLAVAFGAIRLISTNPAEFDGPGKIQLVSDGGCILRNGPATLNRNCIQVNGSGMRVDSVQGYIQAASFPYGPATVCEITVEITGTLQDREPYRASGQTEPGCSLISRGMTAMIGKNFAPDSQVCSRTYWGSGYGWSQPACVTIRY